MDGFYEGVGRKGNRKVFWFLGGEMQRRGAEDAEEDAEKKRRGFRIDEKVGREFEIYFILSRRLSRRSRRLGGRIFFFHQPLTGVAMTGQPIP
jgi:hypothetical protein